jgi:hypothetical protein
MMQADKDFIRTVIVDTLAVVDDKDTEELGRTIILRRNLRLALKMLEEKKG